jgi:hypothetical protein
MIYCKLLLQQFSQQFREKFKKISGYTALGFIEPRASLLRIRSACCHTQCRQVLVCVCTQSKMSANFENKLYPTDISRIFASLSENLNSSDTAASKDGDA